MIFLLTLTFNLKIKTRSKQDPNTNIDYQEETKNILANLDPTIRDAMIPKMKLAVESLKSRQIDDEDAKKILYMLVKVLKEKLDKQQPPTLSEPESATPAEAAFDFSQTLATVGGFRLIKFENGEGNELVSKDLHVKFTPNNLHLANGDNPEDIGYSTMELSCTVDNFPAICHAQD